MENHLHILTHLHPSTALASLVKDIKVASSKSIKETGIFPDFIGGQDGCGAFTYSPKEKQRLINYIKNKKEHHRQKNFREEYISLLYISLLKEQGVAFEEKFLFG